MLGMTEFSLLMEMAQLTSFCKLFIKEVKNIIDITFNLITIISVAYILQPHACMLLYVSDIHLHASVNFLTADKMIRCI